MQYIYQMEQVMYLVCNISTKWNKLYILYAIYLPNVIYLVCNISTKWKEQVLGSVYAA